LEQLKPDCDAFWHLRNLGGADYAAGDEQKIRDTWELWLSRDRAFEPVGRFSGGEKARLTSPCWSRAAQFAASRRADQPPRHRDAAGAQRCAAEFRGGLVVVSHDRH